MKQRNVKLLMIAVLALFVAAPALVFSSGRGEKNTGSSDSQASAAPAADSQALSDATKNLASIQLSFREVAKKVLPVIVEVDVQEQAQTAQGGQNPFDWLFNQPGNRGTQPRLQEGLGSGIIVQKSGDTYYILTNNHVVDGASHISILLSDQTKIDNVKVVGTVKTRDLAILSFTSRQNLPVADLGDSSQMQVGDLVLAVGNPFGYENTITMGIVSALGRSGPTADVATNTDYIQTDAAINQGNSGGALVNIRGQVIGINTWIAAPTGTSVGLGFAIPINNAKKAISDFVNKGKVEYGWLGVSITDASNYPGVAEDLKLENVKGALVINMYKRSPAESAGIMLGDYITRVNGQSIANANQLIQVVGDLLADKSYDFEVMRYGEKVKLSVKLSVRPDDGSESISYKNLWTGLVVFHYNNDVRQKMEQAGETGLPQGVDGVMISSLAVDSGTDGQSPAAIAGFKARDLITQINGKDIHTVMDFFRALNDKSKSTVTIKVNRQGTDVTIGLTR